MVRNKICTDNRVSPLKRPWRMASHTTTPLTMDIMATFPIINLPQRQESARRSEHRRLVWVLASGYTRNLRSSKSCDMDVKG